MNRQEVIRFIEGPEFDRDDIRLIETHISWVILAGKWAYKIKKPVKFSFLDFSTLCRRHKYAFEEVRLNRRLTGDMYIDVLEIRQRGRFLVISHDPLLPLVDYVVKMRRKKQSRRMDRMLDRGDVTLQHLESLAYVLSGFHRKAPPVYDLDPMHVLYEWEDLHNYEGELSRELPDKEFGQLVQTGSDFLKENALYLGERCKGGYYRDVHGDLHCENIFLEEPPVVFDCIEFNNEFRRIDVLNEIAFLCMDLEARGAPDMARHFLNFYLYLNPVLNGPFDRQLFLFYKMYRAGVRAKISVIRLESAGPKEYRKLRYATAEYVTLMQRYSQEIKMLKSIDTRHLLW